MKNIVTGCCIALCLFLTNSLYSQGVFNDPAIDTYISQKKIAKPFTEGYTGSPYANKAFQSGNIYRDGVLLASNVAVRYNALRDEIEVKQSVTSSNEGAKVLRKAEEIYVRITNKLYVYKDTVPGQPKGGYFLVISEGEKLGLYKKITKQFIEGKQALNPMSQDILSQFKEKESFYVIDTNGTLSELPRSRKGKIAAFDAHKKEVKQFIRDERLNVNKMHDLKKLLEFYNSL